MNYEFVESTQSSTIVKILGKVERYEVLGLFPFTSDRKRMSIIVRDHGMIKMYIKGADSIIK
jgi:magnesium-transporting ATPase (P-type)